MSSPTGEVDEVVKDVSTLVNDNEVLDDSAIKSILKDYNLEQMIPIKAPDGKKFLVTGFGKVTDSQFLDPTSGKVYAINHKDRTVANDTEKKQELSTNAKFREAIDGSVQKYVGNMYKANKCVASVFGDDNGNINICISAANVHLGAFWTGGWRSTWTLNITGGGSSKLKGNIKTNVHYFEDGNVQLHTSKDTEASIDCKSEAEAAKAIAKVIEKAESDFQNSLEQMYVEMHRTTFKAMRRFLPKSAQKLRWDTAVHSLASTIGSK